MCKCWLRGGAWGLKMEEECWFRRSDILVPPTNTVRCATVPKGKNSSTETLSQSEVWCVFLSKNAGAGSSGGEGKLVLLYRLLHPGAQSGLVEGSEELLLGAVVLRRRLLGLVVAAGPHRFDPQGGGELHGHKNAMVKKKKCWSVFHLKMFIKIVCPHLRSRISKIPPRAQTKVLVLSNFMIRYTCTFVCSCKDHQKIKYLICAEIKFCIFTAKIRINVSISVFPVAQFILFNQTC